MSNIKPTYYGGQALIEGVMMKGLDSCACAVRSPEGEIVKVLAPVPSPKDKFAPLGWPIIRGIANFFGMMTLGMKTLTFSANIAGTEEVEGEPSKLDKWLNEKLGKSAMNAIVGVASLLGVVIALFLFMFLPAQAVKFGSNLFPNLPAFVLTIFEGIIKIIVFVIYILAVSKMKEIDRVFRYHGAEHKTIHCFEHGQELTPDNADKFPTYHPRCGTSFITLVLVVSIIVYSFVEWDVLWIRVLMKLLLLPVVMGVSYEILRINGRYDNWFTRIIGYPGKLMQKLTVKEPDKDMLEVAITSLKTVIEHEKPGSYPETTEGLMHGFPES